MQDISVHKLGQAVGLYVSKKASNIEQAEYIAYGAEILIGSVVKLSILFFIAGILNTLLEVSILLIVTGVIRTLSGGAHCSAYYRCMVTSVAMLNAIGYITKSIYPYMKQLPIFILLAILVLAICLYWRHAPQAPDNKPFDNRKKEESFRRYTLIAVVSISIISVFFGTDSPIGWTIMFALMWQAFTLTPAGHKFIEAWDALLTIYRKGGEAEC